MSRRAATAIACSNIALAKYWGKSLRGDNLTAVPSLSLTLEALTTTTRVCFDDSLASDSVQIGGESQAGRARERVVRLLDAVRALGSFHAGAEVVSNNDFPTASGLASSASGFAALALAATAAAELTLPLPELSALARRASASAARSLYPGFVELLADSDSATPIAHNDWMDVEMVIAATSLGPKATASTDGMLHTQATSPYYPAWVSAAPAVFAEAKRALLARDLEALGAAMEHSTLLMHASMLGARPALLYWRGATLRVMQRVQELRQQGTLAFFTMDAGPHVKVLCEARSVAKISDALREIPGVERVLSSRPGLGARLVERD